MAKVNVVKEIKDMGWTHISLTKSFEGAVQEYNGVALLFNMEEAMIVRDSQGLFTAKDLFKGIVKSKDFDVEDSGDIEGVEIVAFVNEETGEVEFNEDLLEELKLNDFSVTDSIKNRVMALNKLTEMVAIPLN